MIRKNPMYDTETPPGQVSWPPKRLGDVIEQTIKHEKLLEEQVKPKLSFDEWLYDRFGIEVDRFEDWDGNLQLEDLCSCWEAAQENK